MWSIAWEPIISAGITGLLALVGIVLTIRSQSGKTRNAGLAQHTEQNAKLDQLLASQKKLETKVDNNNSVAVGAIRSLQGDLSDMRGQIQGVSDTTGVLFGMIVDLDLKVTKTPNSRKKTEKTLEQEITLK